MNLMAFFHDPWILGAHGGPGQYTLIRLTSALVALRTLSGWADGLMGSRTLGSRSMLWELLVNEIALVSLALGKLGLS